MRIEEISKQIPQSQLNNEIHKSLEMEKSVKKQEDRVENINKKEYNNSASPMDKIVKKLNQFADIENKGIKFEKAEYNNTWIVKVVNKKSGEIVRQIPSEEMQEIAKGIEEFMGSLFDTKA